MSTTKPKRKHPELIETPTPDMKFDRWLGEGLEFDPEDLSLNRQGYMTDAQIERKLHTFSKTRASESALLALVLISGLIVVVLMASNGGLWSLIAAIGAGLIALFVGSSVSRANTIKRELERGFLAHVMGTVSVTYVTRGTIITIGDEVYNGDLGITHHRDTKAACAFKDQESYILYFLPESNVIISAEPLEEKELPKNAESVIEAMCL